MKKDGKSDVNGIEDFLEVVVTGYVLCAAMSLLGMSDINGMPSDSAISHTLGDDSVLANTLWMEDDSVREEALSNIASLIIDSHIDLATVFRASPAVSGGDDAGDDATDGGGGGSATHDAECTEGDGGGDAGDGATDGGSGGSATHDAECTEGDGGGDAGDGATDGGSGGSATHDAECTEGDGGGDAGDGATDGGSGSVYDYTREVLSLGMLYLHVKDAVREGDGNRIVLSWKYLMLIFKATGRKNYALEALTMLTQYFVTLPPNLAEQLKWNHFVNVRGFPGCNISADLHMEHMNRVVKTTIEGLGANKTEKAIVRAGKSVGMFTEMLAAFDSEAGVPSVSDKRSEKSMVQDLQEIVKQLMESDVFDNARTHKTFSKLKTNLIRTLSERDVKDWILN